MDRFRNILVNSALMQMISRRGFAGCLLASLVGFSRASRAAQPEPAPSRRELRHYRADAAILLFGITIYRRSGVGGGQASFEQSGAGADLRQTFFFAAGSDPKRARGLSRLGWIREVVRGPANKPTEVDYFGVLTASPEETLEHARKAVTEPQAARSLYSSVSGHHTAGHSRSALVHFEFQADSNWSDQRLVTAAQSQFQPDSAWRETSWPNAADRAPATFLYEFAALLRQRVPHATGQYIYNEQRYDLDLDANWPRAGAPADRLVQVRGRLRNQHMRRQTSFLFWVDDASHSIVPVRIQYQPRSFLRLTFEAVPA